MKKLIRMSIVIPYYNGGAHIRTTLNSIYDLLYGPKEIIIVNDGSDKKNSAILHNLRSKFKLHIIDIEENRGVAHARNMGLRRASTEYVLFLDQDCAIDRSALRVMQNVFDKDTRVGGIQMRLLDFKTHAVESQGHFLSIFGFPYELTDRKGTRFFIFGAKTAGFAVRRKAVLSLGGFDEDYLIHGEDTDICWRMWLGGYTVMYLSTAAGYHVKTSSMNPEKNSSIFYEGSKNGISNIIKNADIYVLLFMLPLHIAAWIGISLSKLLSLDIPAIMSIYKGLAWNLFHLLSLLKKRRSIQSSSTHIPLSFILGPYSMITVLKKGIHWFSHV
ncbi:MAG: glycosyltransferase [bacterium]|nr:glycosyltransferase [bacterium]